MTSQWYSEFWSIELNWNDHYWWRGHLAKNLLWIFGSKCESKGGSSYLGVKSGFHPQRPLSNPPTKTPHLIFHKKWLHAFFRDIGFLLISLPLSPSHLSNDRRHLDFFLIVRSDPTVCCCFVVDYQNGIRITVPILFFQQILILWIFFTRGWPPRLDVGVVGWVESELELTEREILRQPEASPGRLVLLADNIFPDLFTSLCFPLGKVAVIVDPCFSFHPIAIAKK